jgi:iron complex transport system substrate-binding protein
MRIVSLLPSATEIICELGLERQLVGVTHECDFPPDVLSKPKVTRTLIPAGASSGEIDRLVRARLAEGNALYSLDFDSIERLQPDLIVSQTLCGVCAVADEEVREATRRLRRAPRVIYLEPTRLRDVFESVVDVGSAAGVATRAKELLRGYAERIERVRARAAARGRPRRVVVLEWLDPPYSCGHWTPDLVAIAGAEEPIAAPGSRSRRLRFSEIAAADPEVLLTACCGYSLERTVAELCGFLRHDAASRLHCLRAGRAYAADGSAYFSRPGPRLIDSLEILAHAVDPELHPLPERLSAAVCACPV